MGNVGYHPPKSAGDDFQQWQKNAEKSRNDRDKIRQRLYYEESARLKLCAFILLDYVLGKFSDDLKRYNKIVKLLSLPGCKDFVDDCCAHLDEQCNWNVAGLAAQHTLDLGNFLPVPPEIAARYEYNVDCMLYYEAIVDFLIQSFNTPDNIINGPKVLPYHPDGKPTALFEAIFDRSIADYYRKDIRAMQSDHPVHPAVDAALYTKGDTRLRRIITPYITIMGLKKAERGTETNHAAEWVGSRRFPGKVEWYLDELSNTQLPPDPREIYKDIQDYDRATGYPRRTPS